MAKSIAVTVWSEYRHEKENAQIAKIYPKGIHGAIAAHLAKQPGLKVRTATLDEPEHGLTQKVLDGTDVLTWWGHKAHKEVSDAVVDRVQKRVLEGMGLIVLHSGHFSKIFQKLMGTSCGLIWREVGEREVMWHTKPGHPILDGVPNPLIIEHEEMYGEHFDIPEPEAQIMISSFTGGEVFRSACCWRRGAGKVFYFRPGHESFPTFHNPHVLRVIANAARWAKPEGGMKLNCPMMPMGWFEPKKGKKK